MLGSGQGSISRTLVVATAMALLSASARSTAGQTRSDSLAVIATVLERARGAEVGLFVRDDAPALVLDAVELLAAGFAQRTGGALTFCSDEMATDGDNIGVVVSISLEPGDGPLPQATPRGDSLQERRRDQPSPDHRLEPFDVWFPAFYMDARLAYVSFSSSCYLRPMRGLGYIELPDGRRVSASSSGATAYELQRQGLAWVITRVLNAWIT